ncbi:hypothetical protein BLOT_016119 [Blomia tropicalis]|nr:hypothetical protein BLOT_016119 [Blomia tropicalis]
MTTTTTQCAPMSNRSPPTTSNASSSSNGQPLIPFLSSNISILYKRILFITLLLLLYSMLSSSSTSIGSTFQHRNFFLISGVDAVKIYQLFFQFENHFLNHCSFLIFHTFLIETFNLLLNVENYHDLSSLYSFFPILVDLLKTSYYPKWCDDMVQTSQLVSVVFEHYRILLCISRSSNEITMNMKIIKTDLK